MLKIFLTFCFATSLGLPGDVYSQPETPSSIIQYGKRFGSTNVVLAQNKRFEWPLDIKVLENYLSAKSKRPYQYVPVYGQTVDMLKDEGQITIFQIISNMRTDMDLSRHNFMVEKTREYANGLDDGELLIVLEGSTHVHDYFLDLKRNNALGKTVFISPTRNSKTRVQAGSDAIGKYAGEVYQSAQYALKSESKTLNVRSYPSLGIGSFEVAIVELTHLSFLGFANKASNGDEAFLRSLYEEIAFEEGANVLVISDFHDQVTIDREILDGFPSVDDLKKSGITKIVLALEGVLAHERPTNILCLFKGNTIEQVLLQGKIDQPSINEIKNKTKNGKEILETTFHGSNFNAWLKKMDSYRKTGLHIEIVGLENGLVDGIDVSLKARGCK